MNLVSLNFSNLTEKALENLKTLEKSSIKRGRKVELLEKSNRFEKSRMLEKLRDSKTSILRKIEPFEPARKRKIGLY